MIMAAAAGAVRYVSGAERASGCGFQADRARGRKYADRSCLPFPSLPSLRHGRGSNRERERKKLGTSTLAASLTQMNRGYQRAMEGREEEEEEEGREEEEGK